MSKETDVWQGTTGMMALKTLEVLGPTMVMVAGDGGTRSVGDGAGLRGEVIPDRHATAIRVDGPLDLRRRGGRAPHEALGEGPVCSHGSIPSAQT